MDPKEKLKRKLNEFKQGPHKRAFSLDRKKSEIDVDARTVSLSFSSEDPYERWFGLEVLGHKDGEIELDRLENGAAVLANHDTRDHIGVVERVWVDGKKGRAELRFANSVRATEVFEMITDGILRHVSVGYFVKEMVLSKEVKDGPNEYRVSRWEPFEISMVSVPADMTVGVDRGIDDKQPLNTEIPPNSKGKSEMTPEEKAAAEAAQKAEIKAAEDSARAEAQKAERDRVAELTQVGESYKAEELAKAAIAEGVDVHELNKRILERGGAKVMKAEDPEIGMTDADVRKFSFLRFIRALGMPGNATFQKEAAFELECSAAAVKTMQREIRGGLIPYDVLIAKRDMNVGTAIDGGNLVGTTLDGSSFIDLLRNAMALEQCGVTTLTGLNGNLAIPRQTGGASHFWLAENGVPTESAAAFDQVALTPKTVGAYTELSRKLILQSSIDAELFAMLELVRTLSLAIDNGGINGTGASNQPTGILNVSGIGDVAGGTNGAAPTWDHVVELETDVSVANADIGSLCYLTNAKFRGKSKRTFIDAGSGERLWDSRNGSTPLNGYRTVVSNQVPSNLVKGSSGAVASAAIFGNFADLIIGMWGGLDLQVNPFSLDTKGAVRITAFQDVDIAVRHAESFSAMQDALTV